MILTCIEDIYVEKVVNDEQGNPMLVNKLVKRNNESLICILDPEDITGVKESYDRRGRVHKTRCIIFHKVTGSMVVKCSFAKLSTKLETMREPNRFKGYDRKS